MAEFDFVATLDETWKILEIILKKEKVSFIPDIWFDLPKPIYFREINSTFKELSLKIGMIYIWGEEFSKHPLEFVFYDGDDELYKNKYRIVGSIGGPYLAFELPGEREYGNSISLFPGGISYDSWYYIKGTNQYIKPTDELKNAYKRICGYIKKQSKRYKFNHWIYVGRETLKLIHEGKARLVDAWYGDGSFAGFRNE